MVEVNKTTPENTKNICKTADLEYREGITTAILAVEKGKDLGSCIYDIKADEMIIRHINPSEDFIMADSLLRSALFIAANKGIMDVFWADNISEELILKLGFVKNLTNCSIDVTNLFSSCKNCKKDV